MRKITEWLPRISMGGVWPTRHSIPVVPDQFRITIPEGLTATDAARLVGSITKLASYSRLKLGWDGRRGQPPTLESIQVSLTVLFETATFSNITPQLFPLPSGGVQIEWHVAGNSVEVEVDRKGEAHIFAETADGEEMIDREVSPVFLDSAMIELRRALKRADRILAELRTPS